MPTPAESADASAQADALPEAWQGDSGQDTEEIDA
jgi:hypothetical protein